jgi:preprotein translocase subunit SecE
MANKKRETDAPERERLEDDAEASSSSVESRTADASDAAGDEVGAAGGDEPGASTDAIAAAESDDEGVEEEQVAGQLGSERYVLAGFFAAGILAAYVLGRSLAGVWMTVANKEWFARALPTLASVPDDSKASYGSVIAAVISLVVTYRVYKRADVRAWSDEVASELNKVKWPSKKEVSNSTTVVIVASLVATAYLTILDRFYAFVTNLFYGNGS